MAKRYIGPRTKREWQRDQWYIRNKDLTKKRAMENKHRDIKWFKETKLKDVQKGCSECKCTGHPDEFDYHHKDPSTKILSVADMLGTYGRMKVKAEMDKCVIICKPCHMKHHYNYPFH